jgi:hypothetical protein
MVEQMRAKDLVRDLDMLISCLVKKYYAKGKKGGGQ